MAQSKAELRVGAHVLVQLGSELVTDVEQAILECVKNAYDADSPSCKIEIQTAETGVRVEPGTFKALGPFRSEAENVVPLLVDSYGDVIDNRTLAPDEPITRHLSYTGRITIQDSGDGMTAEQLLESWLVISGSVKRNNGGGPKHKTPKGRTPLGDKGLGRLGSMKLGDILLVETATSTSAPVASAQFRWADCEVASTVDEIPVFTNTTPNTMGFKGTKVHVFGLKDLGDWNRPGRVLEITRSLARLISPFEATSTFPVVLNLNGADHSLASVTAEVLRQAIAEFTFEWTTGPDTSAPQLTATARFRKRLFTGTRSAKQKAANEVAFAKDNGAAFLKSLETYSRLRRYDDLKADPDGTWYIELKRVFAFSDIMRLTDRPLVDPGEFSGAFYFFHLDEPMASDDGAAAGLGADRPLIKSMAGISILRDGFRVRSQGDWLGIAQGMTSGSTYGMRVNNTIGYFSLNGEKNYLLTEKSDREGFVENSAYKGFFEVAGACRDFANDALEDVRRALDDFVRKNAATKDDGSTRTREDSLAEVSDDLKAASAAKDAAFRALAEVKQSALDIANDASITGEVDSDVKRRTMGFVASAVQAVEAIQRELEPLASGIAAIDHVKQEIESGDEQAVALLEAASVGLAARGLTHELRTHLTEIRQRVGLIQKAQDAAGTTPNLLPHLRSIRASCSAISSAAALIDPMLPRSRATKETITLQDFIRDYIENRKTGFDRYGIKPVVSGTTEPVLIRMNRARLLQVVDNLVRNSVYWLRQKDIILDALVISFDIKRSGLSISDSGPGVDKHYEANLFDIFISGKPRSDQGQGLGLFIIKQLLHLDGCDISLSPHRNKWGRRYQFDLDLRSVLAGG